jgi:hypothetical protein
MVVQPCRPDLVVLAVSSGREWALPVKGCIRRYVNALRASLNGVFMMNSEGGSEGGTINYCAPIAPTAPSFTDAGLHQSAWFVASFVILPRISNELPRKKRYTEVSCFEG